MATRPFLSTPLKTASPWKPKEPRVAFGRRWRELVLPVRAFRVKVLNGAISSIKNVVDDDVSRLDMLGQFAEGARTTIVQLVEHEHVTRVDVRVGSDYIHAIRFHTNKRVGLWIGQAKGTVREIVADDGFAIHALYGCWGHGLRELGAVFHPLAASVEAASQAAKLPLLVDIPVREDGYRADFTVAAADIGVVVVSADASLKWIRVLSRQQTQDLTALQDGLHPGDNEHWLQLMSDERVTGVELVHDDTAVKGVRWTTTMRTTPWIGQYPTAASTRVALECGPDERIGGFYGARGRNGITALGVMMENEAAEGEVGQGDESDTGSVASLTTEQWHVLQYGF